MAVSKSTTSAAGCVNMSAFPPTTGPSRRSSPPTWRTTWTCSSPRASRRRRPPGRPWPPWATRRRSGKSWTGATVPCWAGSRSASGCLPGPRRWRPPLCWSPGCSTGRHLLSHHRRGGEVGRAGPAALDGTRGGRLSPGRGVPRGGLHLLRQARPAIDRLHPPATCLPGGGHPKPLAPLAQDRRLSPGGQPGQRLRLPVAAGGAGRLPGPALYGLWGRHPITPFSAYYDLQIICIDPDATQLTLRFDRYGDRALPHPPLQGGEAYE